MSARASFADVSRASREVREVPNVDITQPHAIDTPKCRHENTLAPLNREISK